MKGVIGKAITLFDEKGAISSFTTDDRSYTDVNGNIQKVRWSADYKDMN